MGKECDAKDSELTVVLEVTGEPAIVINGVPNVAPCNEAPIHADTICDTELNDDPCFGDWLEGRKVQKMFGDRYYSGKVVKYDNETKWYRVVYEDDDFEDLEWHELEELLLPLDISVPLTTLASQRCKPEKSVSESSVTKRRSSRKNVADMGKTSELLRLPKASESPGQQLTEANNISERTWQETSQKQKENQAESLKTPLQMFRHEGSASRAGEKTIRSEGYGSRESLPKMLKMFERSHATEIKVDQLTQESVGSEATVQNTLKMQKEIKKQGWKTARAEKQKRREKSTVQNGASLPE